MKNKQLLITISIILLVLILGGVALWVNQQNYNLDQGVNENDRLTPTEAQPSITITPTTTTLPVTPTLGSSTPNPEEIQIPDNWQTHQTSTGSFTIAAPSEATVNQPNPNTIVITQWGPTQESGTELYDGISLSLTSEPINNSNLKQQVEQRHQKFSSEPIVSEVTDITNTQIAGKQGYKFSVTSLGEREYIFIQLSDQQYLEIINGTKDPTEQGFSQTVEQILLSIKT